MTQHVWPTEADIGGSNSGRALLEIYWHTLFGDRNKVDASILHGINFVKSGLAYQSATGLVATYSTGTAVIGGFIATVSGSDAQITLPPSSTCYIWLKLNTTANAVTSASLVYTTSTTLPTPIKHHCYLGKLVTNATTVSSSEEKRATDPRGARFQYTGSGTGSGSPRDFVLGFRPSLILIVNESQGNIHLASHAGTYGVRVENAGTVTVANTANVAPKAKDYGFQVYGNGTTELDYSVATYTVAALA